MRIYGSRTDESIADRFGIDKSWADNSQQVSEFMETIGPLIVVRRWCLPDIMEGG